MLYTSINVQCDKCAGRLQREVIIPLHYPDFSALHTALEKEKWRISVELYSPNPKSAEVHKYWFHVCPSCNGQTSKEKNDLVTA